MKMTWLVILAMYHKIFQHVFFQNIALFIFSKLLDSPRCRVRSTCARCNCHCELTKTRNSETQWRGSPCRFDQRLDCCSVFYVFWKYYSWLGKTGVRLLYKRWTPKSSGICRCNLFCGSKNMATSRGETRKMIANLNATTHRLKFFVVPQKLMKTIECALSRILPEGRWKGIHEDLYSRMYWRNHFLHIPKNSRCDKAEMVRGHANNGKVMLRNCMILRNSPMHCDRCGCSKWLHKRQRAYVYIIIGKIVWTQKPLCIKRLSGSTAELP